MLHDEEDQATGSVMLVEKTFLFGSTFPSAIYGVKTARSGTVFMRVDQSAHGNEERMVVIVEARRFLAAWCAAPGERRDIARAGPVGWRADYKFAGAEAGFAHGKSNPVPLAVPTFYQPPEGGPPWVDFMNGITRTIWLLAAEAVAFPVECGPREARQFQAIAGLGDRPVSVSELLGELRWDVWLLGRHANQELDGGAPKPVHGRG